MLRNPMDRHREQFDLVGETGTEQPEQRKEDKKEYRQREKKQQYFSK
jgi:hypothetical protein